MMISAAFISMCVYV